MIRRSKLRRYLRYVLITTCGIICLSTYLGFNVTLTPSSRQNNKMAASYQPETIGTTLSESVQRSTQKLLKIYIYNLESELNENIARCSEHPPKWLYFNCLDYAHHGLGKLLYRQGDISVHNTNQFSLDVILHHQLSHSRYRTNNPSEADVFYVPAYFGSVEFCYNYTKLTSQYTALLFWNLNLMPYFLQGKPHVTSLGKIEREQKKILKSHPSWLNLTYITIEKEQPSNREMYGLKSLNAIVAPYPSYVHLNLTKAGNTYSKILLNHNRRVFLFFAAGLRRSNPFRVQFIDQFVIKTSLGFTEYFNSTEVPNSDQLMLITTECLGNHNNLTIEWMQNSVFCLQPHGDSPTRKSFYDSILSGCIPVVFRFPNEKVELPFQRVLDYTNFIVTIPVKGNGKLDENIPVYNYLRKIPQTEINRLRRNLIDVLHLFQFPVIRSEDNSDEKDALDMIVDEIRFLYDL